MEYKNHGWEGNEGKTETRLFESGQWQLVPDISENWHRVNSIIFNTLPSLFKGFRREFVIAQGIGTFTRAWRDLSKIYGMGYLLHLLQLLHYNSITESRVGVSDYVNSKDSFIILISYLVLV